MTTSIKTCFKCGAEKPLTEFYRHKAMTDGHLGKCKCCAKMDARARRFDPRFRETILSYDRARGDRRNEEQKLAHRTARPQEYKARQSLANAVRDGKVQRGERCAHCHCIGKLHGHHEDYFKPLEVIWLCVPCHKQLHSFKDTIKKSLGEQRDNLKIF